MEVLSHDVVEVILERVPAKSLIRLKRVSKQWKSTIESKNFQATQFYRQQSRDPDVLFIIFFGYGDDNHHLTKNIPSSSSSVNPVKLPMKHKRVCSTSCDGLVCLYSIYESIIVINPTTRWHRTLPPANFQVKRPTFLCTPPLVGFGKDIFNGTYKSVLLYNEVNVSLDNNDTAICEVFDFSTNDWRYVTHTPSYKIMESDPVCVEGSVHWLTKCRETKVLSFDLHTETFQVIARAPLFNAYPKDVLMCNLNNRLCVSERNGAKQVIWTFDSDSKVWNEIYSLDVYVGGPPHLPVAVLEENNKLLFLDRWHRELKLHDAQTRSDDLVFKSNFFGYPLCYFQSLISLS